MAKRVWTFGALLMLAGAAFLNLNLAQGQDVVAEIDGLLLKGKEELEPCREFRKKAELQKWKEAAPESPSHATKQEALDTLALLETYPGTPPSHYEAARLFQANHELFASRFDQPNLLGKQAQLEGECDMLFVMHHSLKLLKDIKALKFSKQEANRVTTFVRSYLKNEVPPVSILGVAVRASVLHGLLEAGGDPGRANLAAEAKELLARYETQQEEVNIARRRFPKALFFMYAVYEPEMKAMDELGPSYRRLLTKAKI